ncbi:hypothetical protein Q5762_24440 [Streptomyces sp. P9(2023)]|uniref:hypothetical protein n=1 Tax=Streptomyces sp. P9(2023) TaxID=3064394 RepID=UPI0028F4173B|nr:hypothetical protein [Streptomyces sp. P9(2023)]MDT9691435.1 hypothetical protein [Streptomyces sp. P9(2023)]
MRPLVAGLLRDLADQRLDAPAVRHPLGFLYAPLHRLPDSVLRIHLWPARPHWYTLTTSPYHMHAWDLVSYVHTGTVRNTTLVVSPCREDEGYRVFDVHGEANVDRLVPSRDTVRISGRGDETLAAGSVYRLPVGTFHTTELTGPGGAVTVAQVTRVPGARERVLGPRELGPHRTTRTVCPPGELAAAARAFLDG